MYGRRYGNSRLDAGTGSVVVNADGTVSITGATDLSSTLAVTGDVSIGATPATSGAIRLASGKGIRTRDAANSKNVNLISDGHITGAGVIDIGDNASSTNTGIRFHVSSINRLILDSTGLTVTDALAVLGASTLTGDVTTSGDVTIGTNPSDYGDIKLNKNFAIATRNNANDANKVIVSENVFTGNDTLDIGDNGKWAAIRFHVSTINVMELTATAINLNKVVTMVSAVTMSNASINMTALATSDPGVAGRLWNDSNTVKVSAG
jgi:hypothetical protein